jgi:hypothetical protein
MKQTKYTQLEDVDTLIAQLVVLTNKLEGQVVEHFDEDHAHYLEDTSARLYNLFDKVEDSIVAKEAYHV